MAVRPNAAGAWLRTWDGHPLTGRRRRFDRWSERLHQRCRWADGYAIGPYALRHTAAQAIYEAGGDLGAVALWLGHTLPREIRVPGGYGLVSSPRNRWELRRRLAEEVWGPLVAWPRLAEGAVLAPTLTLALIGLTMPLPPLPRDWRHPGVR